MIPTAKTSPAIAAVASIAANIAAVAARGVDREARFPVETVQALRKQGLLGALIPEQLGGMGATIAEIAAMTSLLAEHCGSSAMLLAMHNSQLVCIVDHASKQPYFSQFLLDCADKGWLIASATTEDGTAGDIFASVAALERDDERCRLRKDCTVLSYGRFADAVVVTMRRTPAAPASDQVLALIERDQLELRRRAEWDALGMRGTCSESLTLKADFHSRQVMDCDARLVLRRTMVPVSHILWSAVWAGLARGAVAQAAALLRHRARSSASPSTQGGSRLAQAASRLRLIETAIAEAARDHDAVRAGTADADRHVESTLASNSLKLSSSTLASEICLDCLLVCGIAGYQENSPFSVARAVRDVLSGPLMVHNDRISEVNGAYLSL